MDVREFLFDLSTASMILAAGFSWAAHDAHSRVQSVEAILEAHGIERIVQVPSDEALGSRESDPLPGYVVDAVDTYMSERDAMQRYDLATGIGIAVAFSSGLLALYDERTRRELIEGYEFNKRCLGL